MSGVVITSVPLSHASARATCAVRRAEDAAQLAPEAGAVELEEPGDRVGGDEVGQRCSVVVGTVRVQPRLKDCAHRIGIAQRRSWHSSGP